MKYPVNVQISLILIHFLMIMHIRSRQCSWLCVPPLSYLFLNLLMETCRGRIVGDGNGNPLQDSCLENPMDRGAWWAAVHGVAQSQTWQQRLSMHALEKEMATHSSILTWRIPGMEEPGGLPSVGSHRVRHDWSDLAAAAEKMVYNEPPWSPRISGYQFPASLVSSSPYHLTRLLFHKFLLSDLFILILI